MSLYDGLKPELLWKHFEALANIPRCSKNEAAAAQYVKDWAAGKGFEAETDDMGNVVVRVPGTAGLEGAPAVVLQGHLDMVGEKDSDSPHDFDKDPIPVKVDGDWISAESTTLGADNGVGLAASLAVGEDPDAAHGPLELLFTVDEETGLTGAQGLAAGFVTGKTMLNLDSEEEGAVYVGCAGGADTGVDLPLTREEAAGEAVGVKVSGLRGGHSGLDINTGRGNAIQVLAWYLARLRDKTDFALVAFSGGDKHNAIPREATATILLPDGGKATADDELAATLADCKSILGSHDAGLAMELGAGEAGAALSKASRDTFLDLVLALPHGVLTMSQDVEGLVETSTNLAVARLEEGSAHLEESTRSSVMPALALAQQSIFATARLSGGAPKPQGGYPGWQPNMDSVVLNKAKAVHEELFGKVPEVKAIHAGLECGIIGEKMGGMDMISFGPEIHNPHSPSECMKISTVAPFYDFVKGLLKALVS